MVSVTPTPYFVLDLKKLEQNLTKLHQIEQQNAIKILHTIKSFNHPKILPLINQHLSGSSVSSPLEIKMANHAQSRHLHLYAPAYSEAFLESLDHKIDTLSFNSLTQWRRFCKLPLNASLGIRINPELHLPIPSYCNPNLSGGRLGVPIQLFLESFQREPKIFENLAGIHLHSLFKSDTQGLALLFDFLYNQPASLLAQLEWINLGGGHNFTHPLYDTHHFGELIQEFHTRYPHIQLYFEPGEAVLQQTGQFVATVLDIIGEIVILDTSTETHLLDVAIIHQRLKIKNTQREQTPYFYQLTGNSCLQGDIIGEYFFKSPLSIGDLVIFEDMMAYTMVKMTSFNGMPLPELIIK